MVGLGLGLGFRVSGRGRIRVRVRVRVRVLGFGLVLRLRLVLGLPCFSSAPGHPGAGDGHTEEGPAGDAGETRPAPRGERAGGLELAGLAGHHSG